MLLLAFLVALPTARTFSGRLAVTLPILLGLVPLLWWVPSGFGPVGRGTVVLAAAGGMLIYTVFRNGFATGVRGLFPAFTWLDAMPVAAAVFSAWVHANLLSVRAYDRALSLLTMNWDNASHFDIFHMQRLYGRVVPLLGAAPDGSNWSFTDYPQGFHGIVAIFAELRFAKASGSAADEVVNYANGSAAVSILVVVMVLATLASLPAFRRRQVMAFPALMLVAAGWIFGPGSSASLHGFPNFFLAVGLASAALVLATTMDRPLRPSSLVPFVGCAVGVTHNWALLDIFVLGAMVMVLQPWGRLRWRATSAGYVVAAVTVLVGLGGLALAVSQLAGVSTEAVLYGVGGVPIPDLGQLAVILLGTAAIAALVLAKAPRLASGTLRRLRWSFAGLAAALVLAVVMASAQLAKGGTLTYYSHKLGIALFLAGLVTLVLIFAAWLETSPILDLSPRTAAGAHSKGRSFPRTGGRGPTAGATVASVLATIAATQAFGFTFPLAAQGLPPSSPSAVALSKESAILTEVPRSVAMLMAATEGRAGQQAVYVTTRPSDIDAILAKQWYDGLTATYTEKGWRLSLNMFDLSGGVDNLRPVVNKIMKADPSARIIVDPDNQAALNHILATLDN
ncbi:hypothetical protein J2T22_000761 [Pseudarthrobacter defluvii]|uniref:Uncharacterized protein n=1 Tax=Pseudarthrobacter defluvii TaxID=410837 RepID=A0ABT9UD65_9MICC|nr:hypothetical protein [Pseudarthrobacter defluvii]MDQ0117591.1 hypothetical protein [Pseudarthrobacter defluvii]